MFSLTRKTMREKFELGLSGNPRPNRKIEKPEKHSGISRRDFIKAGAAAGGAAALGLGGKYLIEGFATNGQEQEPGQAQTGPTAEQLKIGEQDREVAGETIESQLNSGKEIILDRETKRAIYNRWLASYSPEGENYPGLVTAMERMKPWKELMKAEFRALGIPENYAYLAIPESHFDITASSRKLAKGPFQFTAGTAGLYGLEIREGYDQRYDPVASARACARHLKDSYERFNNDWDLALADYNGGYTNEYAKFRKNKNERSYDDYLAWRQARLNEFNSRSHYEHEIRESDKNLGRISQLYGLSVQEIMDFNGMGSDLIIVGKTLKLPPTIAVKMRILRDSLENLNYPEKFYAVLKVIEKEGLPQKIALQELKFNEVVVEGQAEAGFEEVVGKGEGLFAIARKIKARAKKKDPRFELSVLKIQAMLQRQNGIKDPRRIHPGQLLKISLPLGVPASAKSLAKKHGVDQKLLQKFNPAITRPDAALPAGLKVRIPKK